MPGALIFFFFSLCMIVASNIRLYQSESTVNLDQLLKNMELLQHTLKISVIILQGVSFRFAIFTIQNYKTFDQLNPSDIQVFLNNEISKYAFIFGTTNIHIFSRSYV